MQLECDRCEKLFDAPAEKAGEKMPCPYCGDINRVPETSAPEQSSDQPSDQAPETAPDRAPASPDKPEARGLPPESGPEIEITVVRPAMFRAHPFRYLLIVAMFFGGMGLTVLTPMIERWATWLAWPGLVIGLAGLIWYIAWWISTHLWVRLTLSNKRTVRSEGIIRRHTSEVLHDHVRNVSIQQSFLQRILRVGYLGIASAGQKGIEIEIHDIPHPDRVKAIIDEYRKM